MDKVSVTYFKDIVFMSCWGCIFIKNSLCISFSQCQRVVNIPMYYLLNNPALLCFYLYFLIQPNESCQYKKKVLKMRTDENILSMIGCPCIKHSSPSALINTAYTKTNRNIRQLKSDRKILKVKRSERK